MALLTIHPKAARCEWLRVVLIIFAAYAALLLGSPARGDAGFIPGTLVVGDDKTAPAPPWLKPGMRASFHSTSGIIHHSAGHLIPAQPNDAGAIYIPDLKDWFTIKETPSQGASGYIEHQIVAIDHGVAYIRERNFVVNLADAANGSALNSVVGGNVGRVCPVGRDGEVYISPALLAAQAEASQPSFYIGKGPFNLDGRQVRAIIMKGPNKSSVYDLDTGLMLMQTSLVQQANLQVVVGNQDPRGATMQGTVQFKGLRQTNFPWQGKPAPDWVAQVKQLNYKVERFQSSSLDRMVPPVRQQANVALRVMARGPDYMATGAVKPEDAGDPNAMPIPNTVGVTGAGGGPGGLWLPPDGLAGLQADQKLDNDPATGIVTAVSKIARGPRGEVVVITESCPGFRLDSHYDRASGTLLFQEFVDQIAPGIQRIARLTFVGSDKRP